MAAVDRGGPPAPPLLTVAEAVGLVLERVAALPTARRPLARALGLRLAEAVEADIDLPPFDKSLVDGYAIRSADLHGSGPFRVIEEVAAGRVPTRAIGPGEATAIMTGAPIPEGADAVVMVERARSSGEGLVHLDDPSSAPGRNVLPLGRELRRGEVVARPGDRLRPASLGLLASVGRAEVLVTPRARAAIVPTGDELVEPDWTPGPGQIRNSNGPLLRALVESCGAEADLRPIAPDEPTALRAALRDGLAADILIVTGGVSAGRRDLVPGALESLGVVRVFHKVRLKPGKPAWFGVGPSSADRPGPPVFGLPGNPVGAAVAFLLFVRPALDAMQGRVPARPYVVEGELASAFAHRGDRPTYQPARWLDGGGVDPLPWAGSADLRAVAGADGFAIFPEGDRDHPAGSPIQFLRGDWPGD